MIERHQLTAIGRFNRPHGINGELSATLDTDLDLMALRCIVCDIDGIFVPFFVTAVRGRSASSLLVSIDGFTCEGDAATLSLKDIYALDEDVDRIAPIDRSDDDDDLWYADDLIGYTVIDTEAGPLGTITDVDDSTDNVLLIVTPNADAAAKYGQRIMVPFADELIAAIDPDTTTVTVDLPAGLLNIF